MEAEPADQCAVAGASTGLNDYACELADVVEQVLPRWVVRSVQRFRTDLHDEAAAAGLQARHDIGLLLRAFLATDLDAQRSNPLAILRSAVRYPTEVLAHAGIPPVRREPFAVNAFPADTYDLSPATWSDIDPLLQDAGISWSAWKAHEFLRRRRQEGKR
jgi:hypothetical protein